MQAVCPMVFELCGHERYDSALKLRLATRPVKERARLVPNEPHPGCISYLLDLGERVLINAGGGPGWDELRRELTGAGLSPDIDSLVLLSGHIHHAGAAARLQADTGCEVLAGGPDAEALATGDAHRTGASMFGRTLDPVQARPITEPESALELSGGRLNLVRVPGITEGSLAGWIDLGTPSQRLLFAEIHWPPGWNRGHSMDTYLDGLKVLFQLQADLLCDSHHGVKRGKDTVREFIQSHLTSAGNSRAMGRCIEAWQRTHPGENYNP